MLLQDSSHMDMSKKVDRQTDILGNEGIKSAENVAVNLGYLPLCITETACLIFVGKV